MSSLSVPPESQCQPIVVLVDTQMGENIGMCARAMLNCGLERLRLVRPRDGWPNPRAVAASADADRVIEGVGVFATVAEAVADCGRVYATTARSRELQLPVMEITEAAREIRELQSAGEDVPECAILFGPEASGLDNESITHADRLLRIPVNPAFSSLNLAQAVLLFGWEWWRQGKGHAPVDRPAEAIAGKEALNAFLDRLEAELEKGSFFNSPSMKPDTVRNLRAIFQRATPSDRELRMLHGVVTALTKS